MENNKSIRIHTNVGEDTVLHFQATNDIDFLEVLSIKLGSINEYKKMASDTGVIVGRVVANGGFGIPNAKVAIFIKADNSDEIDSRIKSIYGFKDCITKDENQHRYNLLPDHNDTNKNCYQIVGTFPSKRMILDDDVILETYERYYKLTTVTNQSGDYMIYGVPTGSQMLHVDIDLSDIGILSQKPVDMLYKGYNINQFNNGSQFKTSDNLDELAQIFTQNQSVTVFPFWGDRYTNELAITRCDINISYKFEPTCVFMGSTFTDGGKAMFTKNCGISPEMGRNSDLVTNSGVIEMIRKTSDGYTEEFPIHGNQLINGDGVFCYQIPMNLDYMMTNEEGKMVPTDEPNKGIATRARVRFRFSLDENTSEYNNVHRAKYLVPNNPQLKDGTKNIILDTSRGLDSYYIFGSDTNDEDYKDLYMNKVYSVKNYVPRLQKSLLPNTKKYTGIKAVNYSGNNNPLPYNNIRVDISLMFVILCIIAKVVLFATTLINWVSCIFKSRTKQDDEDSTVKACIPFKISDDDTKVYVPGCRPRRRGDEWDASSLVDWKKSRYVCTLRAFVGNRISGVDNGTWEDEFGIRAGEYKRLYIKDMPGLKEGDSIFEATWGARICDKAFKKSKDKDGNTSTGIKPEDDDNPLLYNIVYNNGDDMSFIEGVDAEQWNRESVHFNGDMVCQFFREIQDYHNGTRHHSYTTYKADCRYIWNTERHACTDYSWLRWRATWKKIFGEFGIEFGDMWETALEDLKYILEDISFDWYDVDYYDKYSVYSHNHLTKSVDNVDGRYTHTFAIIIKFTDPDMFSIDNLDPHDAYNILDNFNKRMYVWAMRNKNVFALTQIKDRIEAALAEQQEVVKLNFHNDWLNGSLYFPQWEMKRRKKLNVLNLFTIKPKETYCRCSKTYNTLKLLNTCASPMKPNNDAPDYDAELTTDVYGAKPSASYDGNEGRFYKRVRRFVKITNGIIYNMQNRDGYNLYYYTLGNYITSSDLKRGKTNSTFAPLYATDIILLGSLDENDIHGIPQLFPHLTSTTANIPPMSTLYLEEDEVSADTGDEESSVDGEGDVDANGIDFQANGEFSTSRDTHAQYGNGLFTNITCFNAYTISKTCVNLRRISELGVGNDSTEDNQNHTGNVKRYADGFISQFDIVDQESRSMFATMNYGNLKLKTFDTNTGYYNPEFKYLYPFAFNGATDSTYKASLSYLTHSTGTNSAQMLYHDKDFYDKEYVMFRAGRETGGIRYYDGYCDGCYRQLPFYANSFYFYFGVKDGKTAIDDFNNTYFAVCPKQIKENIEFSAIVIYKKDGAGMYFVENGSTIFNTATIKISIDKVEDPYMLTIRRQSTGDIVFSGEVNKKHIRTIIFNGYFSGNTNNFTVAIPEQQSNASQITDDTYIVTIIDGEGNVGKRFVKVSRFTETSGGITNDPVPGDVVDPCQGLVYHIIGRDLIEKYLPPVNTIGADESKAQLLSNNTYGTITLDYLTIAGEQYPIKTISKYTGVNNKFKITCQTSIDDTSDGFVFNMSIIKINGTSSFNIADYMYDQGGNTYYKQVAGGSIQFDVYNPCTVTYEMELLTGEASNPICTYNIPIKNGGNLDIFINDIPAMFLMGKKYKDETYYNYGYQIGSFYNSNQQPVSISGMTSYFNVQKETNEGSDVYQFAAINDYNSRQYWSPYVGSIGDTGGVLTTTEQYEAFLHKLSYILSMSTHTYIPSSSDASMKLVNTVSYLTKQGNLNFGNATPIEDTGSTKPKFSYSTAPNGDTITAESGKPYIVGNNYCYTAKHTVGSMTYKHPECYKPSEVNPYFNPCYDDKQNSVIGGYMSLSQYFKNTAVPSNSSNSTMLYKFTPFAYVDPDGLVPTMGGGEPDMRFLYEKTTNNGTTSPYYKHMFIDRRLDYDLEVCVPGTRNNDIDKSILYGGYIAGEIINGIEMDYDSSYNIIGNTLLSTSSSATTTTLQANIQFNTSFIDDYVNYYATPYNYIVYQHNGNTYTKRESSTVSVADIAAVAGNTVIGTTMSVYYYMASKIYIYTSQTQSNPPISQGAYMYYDGPNVPGGKFTNGNFYMGVSDICCNLHWVMIDKSDMYLDFTEAIYCNITTVDSTTTGIYYEYTPVTDSTGDMKWKTDADNKYKRLYTLSMSNDTTAYDLRDKVFKSDYVPTVTSSILAPSSSLMSSFGLTTTLNYGLHSGVWAYPTKRAISSICFPMTDSGYTFTMQSCSYNTYSLTVDSVTHIIRAIIKPCDERKLYIPYSSYFGYHNLKDKIDIADKTNIGNQDRFIIKMEPTSGGNYTPKTIRELIYTNVKNDKAKIENVSNNNIHIKTPKLVQTNSTAFVSGFTYDQWTTYLSTRSTSTPLGILYQASGRFKQESMETNTYSTNTYNMLGFTIYNESKTGGDAIGNIVDNSIVSSPSFQTISLNNTIYPYLFIVDERMYVNGSENHLIQKARVIRLSDIYRLEDVTLNSVSTTTNGTTSTTSFMLSTDNTDTQNPILHLELNGIRMYDKGEKAYMPMNVPLSILSSSDSGTIRTYNAVINWESIGTTGNYELHVITNSGITYAFDL